MATNIADKMLIAFFLPSLEGGGTERAIVGLANGIAASGLAVDLVLATTGGHYLPEVSREVRVVNLAARGKWDAVLRLTRYLKRHAPRTIMSALDLANIQLVLAAKLAGFKGRTTISQRATIRPVYARESALRRIAYSAAICLTYSRADRIICNSYAAAEEVCAIAGVQRNRVAAIHNSVDANRIRVLAAEPLCDAWFLKSEAPMVVSIGSLTPVKDRPTLIRAFGLVRAHRNARLAIVGETYDPVERQKIERLIKDLGLEGYAYLAGFDANPYRWILRARVLVSSSLTEGCSNQLLEALALGTPIVATDCPGDTRVLLEHGRWGRLVPVGDAAKMAAAIATSLDDPRPVDGRFRAADFSPSMTMRAYLNVLLPDGEVHTAGIKGRL